MQNRYKIAIVGVNGIVGRTVLKVLEEKNLSQKGNKREWIERG